MQNHLVYNPLKHFYCSSLKCNVCNNFVCGSCVHQSNKNNPLGNRKLLGTPTTNIPGNNNNNNTNPFSVDSGSMSQNCQPGETAKKPLSPSQNMQIECKTCHDKAEIERIKFNIFSVPVQIRTSRSMFDGSLADLAAPVVKKTGISNQIILENTLNSSFTKLNGGRSISQNFTKFDEQFIGKLFKFDNKLEQNGNFEQNSKLDFFFENNKPELQCFQKCVFGQLNLVVF